MSCEKSKNKAKAGARLSGLSALSSKAGHVAGTFVAGVERAVDTGDRLVETIGQRTAPLTTTAVNLMGPQRQQTKRAAGLIAGATIGAVAVASASNEQVRQRTLRTLAAGRNFVGQTAINLLPHAGTVRLGVKVSDRLSSAVGSGVATLSKSGEAGTVIQEKRKLLFFKSKTPVQLWQSRLTPLLNRRDLLSVSGKSVLSSRGVMFETGGKSWHQGTTVFKLPAGQKRTISHLQSLSLPARHYYFNRPVSGQKAVGIATGQLNPEHVPGFVGQVSGRESLVPSWAGAKQALIKAHIQWNDEG